MRILHFSDIHLGVSWHDVPWRDWFSKRIIGGLNLVLGRARRFAQAGPKLVALAEFARRQEIDAVVFTGDYTAMGTCGEFQLARSAVAPFLQAPLGYFNVPGNHDLYVRDVIREGRFEAAFGETLKTELPEYSVPGGVWPWVRWVADAVAVVGVNSARPNPQPWRSSGEIAPDQLEALRALLRDPRLQRRFVFVITHYAPCLEKGLADTATHGLVNASAFLGVCRDLRQGAILCGHVHRRFAACPAGFGVPVLCAGSATLQGREGLWIYETDNTAVHALPGRWANQDYVVDESGRVELVKRSG
jgi:3',5'-cyclic AMP phosphodiesterase CpdA